MHVRHLDWTSNEESCVEAACEQLQADGSAIVSPTKVGYIIMTTDKGGLDRKFALKERPARKPGVVLCSSPEQVKLLASTTPKIDALYAACAATHILLGCILPWQQDARDKYVPKDGSAELVMDGRGTSCFVIDFGVPSELICRQMWEKHRKLVFASSANPSGKGNRGKIEGVGDQILSGVDLVIRGDDYVAAQQPVADESSRYEQGVMVSMVNNEGDLDDTCPTIIRKGLALGPICEQLSKVFKQFRYGHGEYH